MTTLNNKISELTLIDPNTRCNWFGDLSGNDDSITYNDETGEYESNEETYKYWSDLVAEWQKADDRYFEICKIATSDQYEKMENHRLYENHTNDMEHYPSFLNDICDSFEKGEF